MRKGASKALFRVLLRRHGLNELAERHDKYGLGWLYSRHWMRLNREADRALLEQHEDRLVDYLDMDAFRRARAASFSDGEQGDQRIWRTVHLLRWLQANDPT